MVADKSLANSKSDTEAQRIPTCLGRSLDNGRDAEKGKKTAVLPFAVPLSTFESA